MRVTPQSEWIDNDSQPARRIVVLGSPGSGKTTFSRMLAATLDLPHINLDDLYWLAGWRRSTQVDFLNRLELAVSEVAWIIDGNYQSCLSIRLKRADTVIVLDVAPWRCALRAFIRALRRMGGESVNLPKAIAAETYYRHLPVPDMRFWRLILNFRRQTLPAMKAEIAAAQNVRAITLSGTEEIIAFLAATEHQ